jgi:hypothetical protein
MQGLDFVHQVANKIEALFSAHFQAVCQQEEEPQRFDCLYG